jgi:hypothetical protein
MATDEELRAELYQRQQARREAFQNARLARLHGSESAARAVDKAWDPLVQWSAERGIEEPIEREPTYHRHVPDLSQPPRL